MFNLHKDQSLSWIFESMVEEFQNEEEGQADEVNSLDEEASHIEIQQGSIEQEGGEEDREDTEGLTLSEESCHKAKFWMNGDEREKFMLQKMVKKFYNTFVSKMRIPCYERLTYYYYYDVLEALCRHLFQMLLLEKKWKIEEDKVNRIDIEGSH